MGKIEYNDKTAKELEAAKKQLEGDPNYEKPKEDTEEGSLTIPVTEEEDQEPVSRPDKFASEEELVKAYLELEKKLAKGETKEEETKEPEEVEEAIAKGVDFDAVANEYYEGGELSPDTYMDLAKKGYSKDVVDTFIEGHKAKQEKQLRDIYEVAGGRDAFDSAIAWASENMEVEQIKAFNKIIASGDDESIKFAVDSLMSKAKTSMTKNPSLLQGAPNGSHTRGTFQSRQQYIDAIKDPRYKKDPGYRQEVDEKLVRSKF